MTACTLPHKLWTREECVGLERAGLIDPRSYELIEGELVLKVGKKQPHSGVLTLLCAWLQSTFGAKFVAQEWSINVSPEDNPTSEPEPDAIVLTRSVVDFLHSETMPGPADIRLIVEVSDSSLFADLEVKARLYARAGIAEYWVVNARGRRILVHRNPEDGAYATVQSHEASETLAPLAAPEASLLISEIF